MYVHMHGFPARVVFFLKYLWKLQTNNSPSQTLFLFQLPDVYLQIHRQMPSLLSGFQEVCVERNIQPNPPWFMNYPSLHIPLWFLRKLCSLRFKKKTFHFCLSIYVIETIEIDGNTFSSQNTDYFNHNLTQKVAKEEK